MAIFYINLCLHATCTTFHNSRSFYSSQLRSRARTTGAPQNHWFGPAGDPRGAGIGTPEAIQLVWSCHREIINDNLVPADWKQPKAT